MSGRKSQMASKPAAAAEPEGAREDIPDTPVSDVAGASVKKMLAKAKERGFVTYDELNDVLPEDSVSPEKIDDILVTLDEMGIGIVDEQLQEPDLLVRPQAQHTLRGHETHIAIDVGAPEEIQQRCTRANIHAGKELRTTATRE